MTLDEDQGKLQEVIESITKKYGRLNNFPRALFDALAALEKAKRLIGLYQQDKEEA